MIDLPKNAWAVDSGEILNACEVERSSGLDDGEVDRRRLTFGPNRLREMRTRSVWRILFDQVKSLIVVLLAGAAAVALTLGEVVEAAAIVVVIGLNAAIGFVTEWRAVRSMEALRRLGGTSVIVRRSGATMEISAEALVPGDIVVVEAGDSITADLRLLEASKLQVDESALTGESLPVSKHEPAIIAETPLAERSNMLFKGTFVSRGAGEGVVVGTGMGTELGQISALVEEAAEEEATPLEKRLDRLGRRLIWFALSTAGIVALIGIARGKEIFLMIETGVALAVAAIPEGLPIVATIALARGMMRMARQNVLIRRLSAVETLGATTVICTDKTGTLTENKMTVTRLVVDGRDYEIGPDHPENLEIEGSGGGGLRDLLETGVLCGNASLSASGLGEDGRGTGDPMEQALLAAGRKYRIDSEEIRTRYPEVREVAFDPDVKMMATFHRDGDEFRIAVKGAPETVLARCASVRTREGTIEMTGAERERWLARNLEMGAEGLRILALAGKIEGSSEGDPYRGLTFFGLAGMEDPPRDDVRVAIDACRSAGIKVVMVTGDQAVTAQRIAAEIGLIDGGVTEVIRGDEIVSPDKEGEDFERLTSAAVFARVSPKQKLDLIDIHRRNGAIVAMTGDGVNDAPALEKADIGVAMGKRGTQVAKEAADMVLCDDSLSSMVAAVEHGRVIFGNIRKFVIYLFSCNASEVMVVGLASMGSGPLPLLPLQILFLNLVTDVFPALALGVGPGEPGMMKRPPRDPAEPLVPMSSWWAIAGHALSISVAVLGALALASWWLGLDNQEAVTVSFLTLAFAQLWHVFNMRDPGAGFFLNDITRNGVLWAALALCVALLLLAVYLPALSSVLQVERIGPEGWLLTLGMSMVPLLFGAVGHAIYGRWR